MMKDGMTHDCDLEEGLHLPGGLYLVVMSEMVIAEDLRGAILEWDPDAVVIIKTTLSEADAVLSGTDLPLRGGFIAASPDQLATSQVGIALRDAGRSAVLLGDAAEIAGSGKGYVVLMRPFSTYDVHRLLAQKIVA